MERFIPEHIGADYTSNIPSEQPPSMEDMRRQISEAKTDNGTIRFKPSTHEVNPDDYDLTVANNAIIEKLGAALLDYLQLPAVDYMDPGGDVINDHHQRIAIRTQMEKEFGPVVSNVLQHDKLKGGKIMPIDGFIQLLPMAYQYGNFSPELKNKIQEVIPQFPTRQEMVEYATKKPDDRALFIAGFEKAALNFLEIFKKESKAKTRRVGV